MSNYRAIATVTAVIRDIIESSQSRLEGDSVKVSVSPPSSLKGVSEDVLNLFLYQVTPSVTHNSFNSPTRDHSGKLLAKPSLALELHYLLTASSGNEFKAQLMLSNAMIFLQEHALISKNRIAATVNNPVLLEGEEFLADSNLDKVAGSISVSLEALSIEELTKLWSSFFQTDYRLSVAYKVSLVLLESEVEVVPSLPVSERRLRVVALRQPVIERVEPQIMTSDSRVLVIKGRNLSADRVSVKIGEAEVDISDRACLSNNQIELLVPTDVSAGVKPVQVVQKIRFGEDDIVGHKGQTSNIKSFVLAPELKTAEPTALTYGEFLTLSFEPAILVNQKVNVLIGNYVIDVALPATETDYPLNTLTIPLPKHIPPGTYPVHLRIDKADSALLKTSLNPTITINPPP